MIKSARQSKSPQIRCNIASSSVKIALERNMSNNPLNNNGKSEPSKQNNTNFFYYSYEFQILNKKQHNPEFLVSARVEPSTKSSRRGVG